MKIKKLSELLKLEKELKKPGKPFFRYLKYMFFLVPWVVIIKFSTALAGNYTEGDLLADKILIYPFIIIFVLIEFWIYLYFKKYGFNYFQTFDKNIERLKREGRLIDDTINNGNNEKDLSYWFGLFEKGAISEEEYEVKKKEIL